MANQIPLIDLKRQYAQIRSEVWAALEGIMASSSFVMGEDVRTFEAEFARYVGSSHCVGVGSGTSALKLAMQALEIGPGDDVIVPANTYIACAFAVSHLGANVTLVDSGADHLIDVERIESSMTPRTKAIMAVHLYGTGGGSEQDSRPRSDSRVTRDRRRQSGARRNGTRETPRFVWRRIDIQLLPREEPRRLRRRRSGVHFARGRSRTTPLLRDLGQRAKHVHEVIGEEF